MLYPRGNAFRVACVTNHESCPSHSPFRLLSKRLLILEQPAPMYILDEVDAALDLSHTQNIGRLIKTRFKGSQFIVVSLKDGMFQNANRIFRTRFSEGTSVVQGPCFPNNPLIRGHALRVQKQFMSLFCCGGCC
jgi:hypothetical protein